MSTLLLHPSWNGALVLAETWGTEVPTNRSGAGAVFLVPMDAAGVGGISIEDIGSAIELSLPAIAGVVGSVFHAAWARNSNVMIGTP